MTFLVRSLATCVWTVAKANTASRTMHSESDFRIANNVVSTRMLGAFAMASTIRANFTNAKALFFSSRYGVSLLLCRFSFDCSAIALSLQSSTICYCVYFVRVRCAAVFDILLELHRTVWFDVCPRRPIGTHHPRSNRSACPRIAVHTSNLVGERGKRELSAQ